MNALPQLLLSVACVVAYAAAAAVYLRELLGRDEPSGDPGRGWLIGASMLNASLVGVLPLAAPPGGPSVGAGYFAALLALVVSAAFLFVRTRFPVRVAGTLVAPLAALLCGLSALLHPAAASSDAGRSALLITHIALALVGLGAFVLAALLSLLYLVQERQLRNRSFGRLFRRLPSLDALDAATFVLVAVGFVVYTVAVALGMAQASRLHGTLADARTALALIAWTLFAAVIFTRVRLGWRGRQAAQLTLMGCVATVIVLSMYVR